MLQTTDIHANLLPYDYFTDKPDQNIGLLRLAGEIAAARSECPNCLLLDTGDFLQGTPMGDLFAKDNPRGSSDHPTIAVMREMGFDAGTLGNHEFNYGLDFLTRVLAVPGYPVVLANAVTKPGQTVASDTTLFPPFAILERRVIDASGHADTLRVGVIGFVPPQVAVWDRHHLNGRVQMRGIAEAAQAHVPHLRAAGADVVIALSHSGIAETEETENQENAAIPLAAVEGIDVILCGHQHQRLPGPDFEGVQSVDATKGAIHGKPAVMAGFWGSDLGVIDLALVRGHDGAWKIRRHQSALRQAPPSEAHVPAPPAPLMRHHKRTLSHIRTPVAHSEQPMHSYFTHVGFDLALRAVAMAQRDFALTLGGMPDLPVLSAASPFRAGGHAGPGNFTEVPSGPVTLRSLADLYLFPNILSVLRLTGVQLRDWLERAAGRFHQLQPGVPDQPLLNSLFPAYNCDFILGLDYEIDLTQPARFAVDGKLCCPEAQRIGRLTYRGQPVCADQEFLLATNSYRAGGGGAFAGTGQDNEIPVPPEDIRTILTDWIRARDRVCIPAALNWRFAPIAGTSAIFETGPRAQTFLGDVPLDLKLAGQKDDGFVQIRLQLVGPDHRLANPAPASYITL